MATDLDVPRRCLRCHAELAPEVLQQLCPHCAMADAVGGGAVDESGPLDFSDVLPPPRQERLIGDYELLDQGRAGGMGVVYRARQRSLKRVVALKMIKLSNRSDRTAFMERFRVEAEATAALKHPNIVEIYEGGDHNGQPYFSMEFIDGGDLRKEMETHAGQPLPLRRAAELMVAIAGAVHHAHERGILHRDLKPANILLDAKGNPYVTDFGLAKIFHQQDAAPASFERRPASGEARPEPPHQSLPGLTLTSAGAVMGSPGYASPEQALGKSDEVTKASDIFGLGAIFYQLITGQTAYPTNWEQFWTAIQSATVRNPSALNPKIDSDLERICLMCLEKEPARRYGTAQTLAQDLGHWLRGEPVVANPVGAGTRVLKWVRRHPIRAGLIVSIGASLTLAGGLLDQWHRAEKQQGEREAALRRLSLKRAESQFVNDRADLALASLASTLREQPGNRAAAERIINALNQRRFLMPVPGTLTLPADKGEFSPDGRRRVVGRRTTTIAILDVGTSNVLVTIPNAHQRVIRDARFSADGERVISAGADGNVFVWNAHTGVRQLQLSNSAPMNYAEFSPDGKLIVTASRDNTARLWDARNGQRVREAMLHDNSVATARFSSNGLFIVSASEDHTVRLWDVQGTIQASEPARLATALLDARFTADSRHVVAVSFDDRTNCFRITRSAPWETATMDETAAALAAASPPERLAELRRMLGTIFGGEILAIDLSPDRRFVAAGCADGAARIWLTRTLEAQTEPLFHDTKVNCVRFSPDNLRLVTSTSGSKIRLWDVQTGQPLSDPDHPGRSIVAVAFSNEGRWVVTSAGLKFEVPLVAANVAPWFPQLIERLVTVPVDSAAFAGGRSSSGGPVILDSWQQSAPTDPLVRWAKRAMNDPAD